MAKKGKQKLTVHYGKLGDFFTVGNLQIDRDTWIGLAESVRLGRYASFDEAIRDGIQKALRL